MHDYRNCMGVQPLDPGYLQYMFVLHCFVSFADISTNNMTSNMELYVVDMLYRGALMEP